MGRLEPELNPEMLAIQNGVVEALSQDPLGVHIIDISASKLASDDPADFKDDFFGKLHDVTYMIGRHLHNYPDDIAHPLIIRSLITTFEIANTGYDDKNFNVRTALALAEDLAKTPLPNATSYYKDIGEKVLTHDIEYYKSLGPDKDASVVRMKHMYHGVYKIARKLQEFGLDPDGLHMKAVTELIFELFPDSDQGLRDYFDQEDIQIIVNLERLYGSIVKERYAELFKEAVAEQDYYKANGLLDLMFLCGYVDEDEVNSFLKRLLAEDDYRTYGIAYGWYADCNFEFAIEICKEAERRVLDSNSPGLMPDEEPF